MEEVVGLGLADFLVSGSGNGDGNSQEAGKASIPASPEKKEEAPPDSQEAKAKPEQKAEEKQEGKEAGPGDKTKPEQEPKAKPGHDYEKQYKDTQKWANNINQKNLILEKETLSLKRELEILNKKYDGTYDPEKDDLKAPPVEQQTAQAMAMGKTVASLKMAAEIYKDKGGEAYIEKMIYAPDAPFRKFDNNPAIQQMVLSSDAPVMAAMKILEEQDFRTKWGDNPTKIEANIRKKVEEELTEKLSKDIEAKIMERLNLKDKQIQGVGNARSSQEGAGKEYKGSSPLSSVLPLG